MSRNKEHRPNGAAAECDRPIGDAAEGGASVFFVSAHLSFYIMNIYGYSLYNPCIFHIYMCICPNYFPYIFLCMFRDLCSQQIYIFLIRGCRHKTRIGRRHKLP